MSDQTPEVPRARGRLAVRVASTCVVAGLSVALLIPPAFGDTLADLRRQVAQTQESQADARKNVAESHSNVGAATQRLLNSQSELENAQAALANTTAALAATREEDRRIAAALAQARAELAAAKQRVARAEAEVDEQLALIGAAARESFQQQNDLQGLGIVLGAETPAELSQRLQWSTTIFDTQAAEKARLDAVLAELEEARRIQAEIEAKIADEKAASARMVSHIAGLEAAARQQRNAVASLVSANEQARSAAQSELDADERAYRVLESEEAQLQKEIKAEAARLAAEEARRKQEEARRAQEAAEAAKRAAAQQHQQVAASRPATTSRDTSRASGATSSYGFIHPTNARYGSPFGQRFHPILKYWRAHNGVDMGAATGTPIYASRDGVVLKAGPNGGFGNFVLIGHGNVINGKYTTTGYAHQSKVAVKVGQQVKQGQLIGYVGNTGLSTTPHLHFELRLDGVPVNPVLYVP